MREATEIVQERRPDISVEGPIQYDAAVEPSVAEKKMPESEVAGRATVFIFPDLETGNIAYKAVQRSAGAVAIGPVLQGLSKPVNDLSRGCTVPDIVSTVVITAIQAQEVTGRSTSRWRQAILGRPGQRVHPTEKERCMARRPPGGPRLPRLAEDADVGHHGVDGPVGGDAHVRERRLRDLRLDAPALEDRWPPGRELARGLRDRRVHRGLAPDQGDPGTGPLLPGRGRRESRARPTCSARSTPSFGPAHERRRLPRIQPESLEFIDNSRAGGDRRLRRRVPAPVDTRHAHPSVDARARHRREWPGCRPSPHEGWLMTALEQARSSFEAGHYGEARSAARQGLAAAPDDPELLSIAGRAGVELGSSDRRPACEGHRARPDSSDAWRQLGDALLAEGRDRRPATRSKAVELNPDDDVALSQLGTRSSPATRAPSRASSRRPSAPRGVHGGDQPRRDVSLDGPARGGAREPRARCSTPTPTTWPRRSTWRS